MFSTYREDDVTLLLKDISGQVTPLGTAERERRIQAGTHYSEMLPIEYEPSAAYMEIYGRALSLYAGMTAGAVASVSCQLWRRLGRGAVLVSLARAGTSIGVLIKRYLQLKYGVSIPHYSISIIRGVGIDVNAMNYILERHPASAIQFVDGWTGKGAIQRELCKAMEAFPGVNPGLAVLSDPANVAMLAGTRRDFLIASSCLNATVSGLLSRTFLRHDIIGPRDFHGAAFYDNLRSRDVTYQFIGRVAEHFCIDEPGNEPENEPDAGAPGIGLVEVRELCRTFGVRDINLVKPGIGEATRVLLRRLPWKILVHSLDDCDYLGHLYQLAAEKQVPLEVYPLRHYKACGIIRDLGDA